MADPRDFAIYEGIRVTSVSRTLLDLTAILTDLELSRAIDRAERQQLLDLRAIDDLLARARGRRGAKRLPRVLAAWRPRDTRSELEDRFIELLQGTGLPSPRVNVLLAGESHVHEVDGVWPDRRLVVQLDGFAYHRTRLDRERDAGADADLELAGYRGVRLTWGDVTAAPRRTIRRLDRLLMGARTPD